MQLQNEITISVVWLINEVVISQDPYRFESSAATYCRKLLECLNKVEESVDVATGGHVSDTMLYFLLSFTCKWNFTTSM